jgi:hypothetical protein
MLDDDEQFSVVFMMMWVRARLSTIRNTIVLIYHGEGLPYTSNVGEPQRYQQRPVLDRINQEFMHISWFK